MTKFIYIFNEHRTTNYKIGFSHDPEQRKSILQPGNPRKLILVDWFECVSGISDGKFKIQFKKFHLKNGGGTEWYKIPKKEIGKVRNKIKKMCQV